MNALFKPASALAAQDKAAVARPMATKGGAGKGSARGAPRKAASEWSPTRQQQKRF